MAKLADARDLKSLEVKLVPVRVRLPALHCAMHGLITALYMVMISLSYIVPLSRIGMEAEMDKGSHIKSIERQTDNRFLNMYHLGFEDRDGNPRDYYFCTRNSEDRLKIKTHE